MSEMVERVARACFETDPMRKLEMIDGALREKFRVQARAAIKAMREPTKAMGAAGLMASSHNPIGGAERLSDEAAEKIGWADRLRADPSKWEMPVWRAMIDEALK